MTVHEDLVDISVATDDAGHTLGVLASPLVFIEFGGGLKKLAQKYVLTRARRPRP